MKESQTNNLMNLLFRPIGLLSILLLISCNSITKDNNGDSIIELNAEIVSNEIINGSNFAFPNGKLKCLVISFDDGSEHDHAILEKLNKANIAGTFHLNSGRLGEKAEWLSSELEYDVHFVSESEVSSIYYGHEISGHGAHHKGLDNPNDSIIESEVSSDLKRLNQLVKQYYS